MATDEQTATPDPVSAPSEDYQASCCACDACGDGWTQMRSFPTNTARQAWVDDHQAITGHEEFRFQTLPAPGPAATETARSAAATEFLLSSAIGHAGQPDVLPEGVAQPIQHLLRNVMYYRQELAGSWLDAAAELAEAILSIDPVDAVRLVPATAPTEAVIAAGARALFDLTRAAQHSRNPDRMWERLCADGDRPYYMQAEAVLRAACRTEEQP